jgi:AcrR family transcriptional regulator
VTHIDRSDPAPGKPTPARRSRGTKAKANDQAIWNAAIDAVAAEGLDRVTARQVADRAGLSSGAIYSRYDSVPDLLAEVWSNRARSAFDELVVAVRDVLTGTADARPVLAAMRAPSPALLAALELCIASNRIPELADVVPDDVRGCFDDLGVTTDSRLAGCVATVLGGVVYNPGDAAVATHVGTVLRWVADREAVSLESPPPVSDPPPAFVFDTGDPDRDLLLHAAAEVTARSGVHHATLKRIGRVAGYVPSFVYSVYDGRDELFLELISTASAQLMGPDTERVYGAVHLMAGRLAGWCHPDGRHWRRMALECCLTRTYFPQVWRSIRAYDLQTDRASLDRVLAAFSVPTSEQAITTMLWARRPATYGAGLLADVTGGFVEMDWRPFLLPVVEAMRATAG